MGPFESMIESHCWAEIAAEMTKRHENHLRKVRSLSKTAHQPKSIAGIAEYSGRMSEIEAISAWITRRIAIERRNARHSEEKLSA